VRVLERGGESRLETEWLTRNPEVKWR